MQIDTIKLSKIENEFRRHPSMGLAELEKKGIYGNIEAYVNHLCNSGWSIERTHVGYQVMKRPPMKPRCLDHGCDEPPYYHGLCKKHWMERP